MKRLTALLIVIQIEELYKSCAAVGLIANAVSSSERQLPAGNDDGLAEVVPTDYGSMRRDVERRGLLSRLKMKIDK